MAKINNVLAIVGPTASGKSALAVELAKKFKGEIVSADSRQVYRGLDIGTGKVTKKEMLGVPHYLLDVASPKSKFTAHDFAKKARAAMLRIAADGSLPIVVGGTGFYLDVLLGRIDLPDVPPDPNLRERLEKRSAAQLLALLRRQDPRRARTIEPHHKRRIIRALEIAASKKRASTNFQQKSSKDSPRYNVLWIGIRPWQRMLEQRIAKRLRARIGSGMVNEAHRLHKKGLSYRRMAELGLEYRALSELLQKKTTTKTFEETLYRDIRRYAKKQLAYWRRNKDIRWYRPEQQKSIEREVRAWLKS